MDEPAAEVMDYGNTIGFSALCCRRNSRVAAFLTIEHAEMLVGELSAALAKAAAPMRKDDDPAPTSD